MASDTDAADLVEQFKDVAIRIAAGFGRRRPWLADDFTSDSLLALLTAAKKYTPDYGPFRPFVIARVRWACLKRLGIERRKNPTAFHQRTDDESDPLTFMPGREPPPEARAEAADLLDRLPPARRGAVRAIRRRGRFTGRGWRRPRREWRSRSRATGGGPGPAARLGRRFGG